MEQPQRSQLELYAQVIAAYQRAGFWPLFKHAYMESGKKWRANGWFWITLIGLAVILWIMPVVIFSDCPDIIKQYQFSFFIIIGIASILIFVDLEKKIRFILKEDIKKYGSLVKIYGINREFIRYILFRNALIEYKIDEKDVKNVKSLFKIDRQTLGSYVAQRPLNTWMATTLTLILANSAKNWPPLLVGMVAGIIVLILFAIPFIATVTTNQRRQYELYRWLAWYEADARKLTPANTGDAELRAD